MGKEDLKRKEELENILSLEYRLQFNIDTYLDQMAGGSVNQDEVSNSLKNLFVNTLFHLDKHYYKILNNHGK